MMLIEIRVGPGKRKLSSSISKVKRHCNVHSSKMHRVPHISLYGPFNANRYQVQKIKNLLELIGKKYSFLPYLIDGFKEMEGQKGRVIHFNIIPSNELKKFRKELAKELFSIAPSTSPYDKEGKFKFHSTLAYKLSNHDFNKIWPYVSTNKTLTQKVKSFLTKSEEYTMRYFYLPMCALRVTFLDNNRRIICEYDFLQRRLLNRREALTSREWQKTLKLFRQKKGMEKCESDKKSIYLISDLHLDHANIINYCARPFSFSNVKEMNNVLIDNWNKTVKDNLIYFLGDMSFGRNSKPAEYWLKKLRGNIHFIKGTHEGNVKNSKEYEILKYKKHKFLLVHDPNKLPFEWDNWIIHGHKHNNDVKNYPFINGDKKTINVSVELVNYKPVSLDYLISLKLDSIKRMDIVDSIPIRK